MKTILITGASSGIGKALAQKYAAQGVLLILNGRDEERLNHVAQICLDKGARVLTKVLDVTDKSSMKAWIEDMDNQHVLDLVIANAGISGGTGGSSIGEPDFQVENIFEINVQGVFNTVHPILPRMVQRRSGQIAIMSSLASFRGWPGAPAYSAAKAAVRIYGEGLRGVHSKNNVKINVICPGFIKTPMTDVNDYAMPFMINADKAAEIIIKDLKNNKGRIAFPWQTYFFAWFIGCLPDWIAQKLLSDLPSKPMQETQG